MKIRHLFAVLISSLMLVGMFSISSFAASPVDCFKWSELCAAVGDGMEEILLLDDIIADSSDGVIIIPSGKSITLDLNGHKIDRNLGESSEAVAHGGVIEVEGTLTITDSSTDRTGKITGGYSEKGGGIYIGNGGKCTIEGGSIEGNKADNGGGVYIDAGGQLTMTGGSITGNEANVSAGGVLCSSGSSYSIDGSPKVTGNTAPQGDNLLLGSSAVIDVVPGLAPTAKIDLVAQRPNRALTRRLAISGGAYLAESVFTYDGASGRLEVRDGGEMYLIQPSPDATVSSWQALQDAINDGANCDKIISLAEDITASGRDSCLQLNDRSVIIDLNGCTIDRNLDSAKTDGHVVELLNNSTLTIRDSAGSGRITGGNSAQGGAVYIHEGCTCKVESGMFTGNSASDGGGAFYVKGMLKMLGGTIIGNSAQTGGGVYSAGGGQFELGGSPAIKRNKRGNVYLADGNKIIISGTLNPAGKIGVTLESGEGVFTSGLSDTAGNSIDSFSSDDSRYEVTKAEGDDPEAQLSGPDLLEYIVKFEVKNGAWNDGTTGEKTVTKSRYEDEDLALTLKDEDIPAVGEKPGEGYEAGSWDVTPDTEKVISENTTYTYTYKKSTEPQPDPKPEPQPEPKPTPKPAPAKISGTLLAKMTAKGKTKLELSWTKVNGAEGYDIFFNKCGKEYTCKRIKTIKGNKTFKWTAKGLKKKTSYKAAVKAWVMKDGKKTYVRTGPMVHAFTSGGSKSYTNAQSVTVDKDSVSLKAGKTYTIKASVTKLQKGKKLISKDHAPKLRYVSSNSKVATVGKSGKITAKGKGSCKVFVLAVNGVRKAVSVTVK